jgi:hypothetical protein
MSNAKTFTDLLKSKQFSEKLLERAPGLRTTSESGTAVSIT